MNRDIESLLDDFIDGELASADDAYVRQALARSPELRREAERRRELIRRLAALPETIEPRRDLWQGIARRLEAPAAPPHRWRTLLLAASLAAFALTLGFLAGRRSTPPGPATTTTAAQAPAGPTAGPQPAATRSPFFEAEQALVEVKRELRLALESQRPGRRAETLREIDGNLLIIEQAINDIHLALDQDPANPELNRTLMAYHEHEIELLERATHASRPL